MASEKKSGAGALASGVLERLAPPKLASTADDQDQAEVGAGEPESTRRLAPARETSRKSRGPAGKGGQSVKGRTIYLPEMLFERIMVQAHRKGRTISEYVTAILERQVPDYRTTRADASEGDAA